jgi:hypothetical protein
MREITEHKINDANQSLAIYPSDEIGDDGASVMYLIGSGADAEPVAIKFRGERGIVTNEALLAIVIDRFRGLQTKAKDKTYMVAKGHLESALRLLAQRK